MSKPTAPAGPPTTPPPKPPADANAGTPAPDASRNQFKLFAEIFGSSVVAISAISVVYDFFFSDRFTLLSFLKRDKVQTTQNVQVPEKIEATTEKVQEVVTPKEQNGPQTENVKEEEDIYEAKTKELEETFLICPEMHEAEEPCPEKKRSFEDECPAEAE